MTYLLIACGWTVCHFFLKVLLVKILKNLVHIAGYFFGRLTSDRISVLKNIIILKSIAKYCQFAMYENTSKHHGYFIYFLPF